MKIIYPAFIRVPTEKAHGLQIMKTCEAFVRAGHEVELLVPARENALVNEDPFEYYGVEKCFLVTRLPGIDLTRFGSPGFFFSMRFFAGRVAQYLKTRSVDMIFSRDENILVQLRHLDKPLVWESHTGSWNESAQELTSAASHIAVLTHAAKGFYIEKGIPEKKLLVAPDGIDLDDFAHPESKETARIRLGLPLDKKIVLYIGRLDGWKGTDTLYKATELLPSDMRVVIIGGEPRQVEQLKKSYPNISFLGYRPYKEIANNLAVADVFVLPNTGKDDISVRFTSPLKLFTYMASNRPIVASNLPSIRDVLSEESAYLVPPDDFTALAHTIQQACDEESGGQSRALRALEIVGTYTWSARVDSILKAFHAH